MDAARRAIGDKLATGMLPRRNADRTWAGFGGGGPCDGCGGPISSSEVEYELEFAGPNGSQRAFHLHVGCLAIWQELKDVLR
jgi:hypothetical protein